MFDDGGKVPPCKGYEYDYDPFASKDHDEAKQEALRYNAGKPEFSYILDYPRALEALCRVMEYGAKKYGRDNWKLGNKPDTEYFDACLRHLYADRGGVLVDDESSCIHLAHALWNIMTLLELNRASISDSD